MKNNYNLQAKHLGLTVVMLTLFFSSSFAQLFTQDFSLGNPVSQYVSATPSNPQYTAVSTSGSASVSAASNALVFSRPGSGQGAFSRIQNFSPLPTSLLYSFTLSATSTAALNSVARWKVGQNFTNSITSEASSNTHSQLGLDYGSPSGQWRLRDIGTGTTSAFFSGTQTITWAINNSGASISYFGPNGAAESVGNDKMDVWVGTTKVFDDKSVTTGSVNLEDLKFYISGGNGTVTMDNFLIDPITSALTCAAAVTGTTDPDNCNGYVTVLPPVVNSVICNPVVSILNDFNGTDNASDYYPIGETTINWTIVDNCGNTFTCSSTVTISDNDSPAFICLGNQTVFTDPNVCSYLATGGIFDPIVTDNCTIDENSWSISGATIGSGTTSIDGTVFNHGTTNVTWTATDVSGNSAICSFDVIVNDGQTPSITCPSDIGIDCTASTNPSNTGSATAVDNCDESPSILFADVIAPGSCAGNYVITRTWTATDASLNSSSCSQTITVTDVTPPVITCPASVTIACTADNTPAGTGSATAVDACSGATVTHDDATAAGSCTGNYVITRTWTATDGCGNASSCVQTITVVDNVAPVISCPASVTITCADDNTPSGTGSATATDNCSGVASITHVDAITATSCAGSYTIARTWTATDGCGNASSCVQTITVTPTPMAINCPADVTVTQDQERDPYATGYATAFDCSGDITITYNDDRSTLHNCNSTGFITRTWTATSACGSATCNQIITVIDSDNPVTTCPEDITTVNDPGLCSAVVNFTSTALDFGYFQGFENPAWLSGNYINTPSTDWNDFSSAITRAPSGTDGITSKTGTAHAVMNSTSLPASPYDYTGTFNRLGGYNNTFGLGFISKVDVYLDMNDPALAANTYGWDLDQATSDQSYGFLRDFIFHAAGDNTGIYIGASNNTNFTRESPAFIQTQPHATITTSGWYTMEWEAKDNAGNMAMDFNVRNASGTIIFTTTINTTDNIATTVGGNRYMWFNFLEVDKLAIDNTSLQRKLPVTSTPSSGSAFAVGTTLVNSSATDACGHTTSCSINVIVNDNEVPTITCPSTLSVNNDLGLCSATVASLGTPVTNDNCAVATVTNDHPSTTYLVGTTAVIWTVTDIHGNSATCSQNVIVTDNEAPSITCPATVSVNNDPGACDSIVASIGSPITNDNCEVSTVVNDHASTTYPVGTTVVTWTVTDIHGNSNTCAQNIVVTDNENPIITCPAPVSVACAGDVPAVNTNSVTASDNCGAPAITFESDVISNQTCVNRYTLTRTYKATDIHGNISTCAQTITVFDDVAPVLSGVPASTTADCASIPVAATVTATDNCGSATVALVSTITPGSCAGNYTITRTWTATDACGNAASASQTITVTDVTAPVPDLAAGYVLGQLDGQNGWNGGNPCGGFVNSGPGDADVVNTVVQHGTQSWYYKHGYGSPGCGTPFSPVVASVGALATGADGDQSDIKLSFKPATLNDNSRITVYEGSVNRDDRTGANLYIQNIGGGMVNLYMFSYDASIDDFPQNDLGNYPANVWNTVEMITDYPDTSNVDSSTWGTTKYYVNGNLVGTYVTWTHWWRFNFPAPYAKGSSIKFTNNNGGDGFYLDDVSMVVNNGGSFVAGFNTGFENTALPDVYGECCATIPYAPTATDLCEGDITGTTTDALTYCTQGTHIVTWTYNDGCGNTSTQTQNVVIDDITAPVLVGVPANTTADCASVPVAAVVTATDNCGSATVAMVESTTPGSCASNYTITRTWTADDGNGNTTIASQSIVVSDVTPPVLVDVPANTTVDCSSVPVAAVVTATDNCSGATVAMVESITPGLCAGSYTITRTWTATDGCGNASSSSQTINVQDNAAPVIAALPATTTINCPNAPVFAVATAVDACGSEFTLTSADVTTPGACAGSYSVTRTWTATDACLNSSTASQTIIVQDVTAPVIAALPAASTINCPATPSFATATATDACGSAFTLTFADVTTNGACAGSYSVTRTWTATDGCGNTSSASQTINVQDVTAPVIAALPGATTINCPATPEFAVASATDACGSAFTLTSNDVTINGACAGSYSVTRTWTATDACGNVSSASQTINVQDVTAPVIAALPATSTINCPATPEFAVASATDACGSAFTLTSNDVTTNGACAGSYSVTRTWTATDGCGNTSTASQTINVQDVTAPVIAALPGATTINCPATPSFATATATDLCGSAFTLTSNDVSTNGACAGSYSVTRTWTATDGCGNVSTASQTINVQDITAPVIAALPAASTINCPATPAFAVATATDACGSAFTLTSNDVTTNGACAGSYSVTRTWTATDGCGNTSSASQTINVQDVTAPVIAALPAASTINCPATPSFAVATATDACGSSFTLTSADVTTAGSCAGNYSVTRTWTATDGCGNVSTASQTITAQDITAPTAICQPVTVTLSNAGSATITASQINNGSNDACSAVTISASPLTFNCTNIGANNVTLTVTDLCGNVSTCVAVVTVLGPISLTTSQIDVKCRNQSSGKATVTASGGTSPYTYLWSNGKTTATVSLLAAGTYTVTVTDASGCKATTSVTITQPATSVTVNISGTFSGGTLTANASGGTPGYTYLWNTGATTACVGTCNGVPLVHGTYTVTVTDANGCKAASSKTIKLGDAQDVEADAFDVNLYPNPASDQVILEFTTLEAGRFDVRFTDVSGRMLFNDHGEAIEGSNTLHYDLSRYASGTYFFTLIDGDKSKVMKVIVQK